MSRAEELWERLVRAALRRERTGTDAFGHPVTGIAGNVPSSLANNRDIDEILRAADEIQDEDPNVSRICMKFLYFYFLKDHRLFFSLVFSSFNLIYFCIHLGLLLPGAFLDYKCLVALIYSETFYGLIFFFFWISNKFY